MERVEVYSGLLVLVAVAEITVEKSGRLQAESIRSPANMSRRRRFIRHIIVPLFLFSGTDVLAHIHHVHLGPIIFQHVNILAVGYFSGVGVPLVSLLGQEAGLLKLLPNNSGGKQASAKAFVVSLPNKPLRMSRYCATLGTRCAYPSS